MTDTAAAAPRRREQTRQRLLDAAAELFAEVGMDAASVEAICERAGFTRGAFYSNYATKEELFLDLCARTADAQIAAVRDRIAALEVSGGIAVGASGVLELVRQVLEVAGDDRLGVLLLGEVRIHALRSPALAEAYLTQNEVLRAGVAQIVQDIVRANGLRLRAESDVAAGMLLSAWTGASERAVMLRMDRARTQELIGSALAETADLLIAPA